jgi:hypothetical protein
MLEEPSGSGHYVARAVPRGAVLTLSPELPDIGLLFASVECPDEQFVSVRVSVVFGRGVHVHDAAGSPVAGANVTLLRALGPEGPYETVDPSSPALWRRGQRNPLRTDDSGDAGWALAAGWYRFHVERDCDGRRVEVDTAPAFHLPDGRAAPIAADATLECG